MVPPPRANPRLAKTKHKKTGLDFRFGWEGRNDKWQFSLRSLS
jgi:hypothetical protein